MGKQNPILVIGAGPSGLTCALALTKAGQSVRIIDKRPARRAISKATGVSLGTIKALTSLGIPESIVHSMTPMSRFLFYEDDELIADISIPKLNGEPPAYLYPQHELEKIIEFALAKDGVVVEYDTSVETIISHPMFAQAHIRLPDGVLSTSEFQWVIGADGAHSAVREMCGFEFKGRDYPESWSVAEIETNDWDNEIQARLFLGSDGVGLFLSSPQPGIVQGIMNAPNVDERLKQKYPAAKFNYTREFSVSLKKVPTPRINRVWVIGDAAHVQSPVGGQGLNLAIADAMVLSKYLPLDAEIAEQKLKTQSVRTLRFTDFDYRMLATKSKWVRILRNSYWGMAAKYPAISKWFFRSISGIDHYRNTDTPC